MTSEPTPPTGDRLEALVRRLLAKASVKAVYGEPLTQGERTIIPISEVFVGMGFGFGGGTSVAQGDQPEQQGNGGGGGGSTMARPVGIVVIEPSGVHVEPVVDVTKLGLALFTTVAAIGIGWMRMKQAYRDAQKHTHIA